MSGRGVPYLLKKPSIYSSCSSSTAHYDTQICLSLKPETGSGNIELSDESFSVYSLNRYLFSTKVSTYREGSLILSKSISRKVSFPNSRNLQPLLVSDAKITRQSVILVLANIIAPLSVSPSFLFTFPRLSTLGS